VGTDHKCERNRVITHHHLPSTRAAWVKRAVISGAVGVVSGFVVHVAMGGVVPGLAGIIPAAVAATLVSLAVLYKPGVVRTVVATLSSQWFFHNLAGLGVGSVAGGHVHGAVEPLVAVAGADIAMGLGHIVAAIVTAGFVLGVFRISAYVRTVKALVAALAPWLRRASAVVINGVAFVPVESRADEINSSQREWSARPLRGPPTLLSY
jgi:hypothetical protein